ncbi:nuA3 HAT complex component nto1 [Linnemannia zychae]|nr:nuA3 HAT complex component nto1 [Linnemannia zychae]
MPQQNSNSPSLPRLQASEVDEWIAKVKAVPHNSTVFSCILPGCNNSYQTKQGLERHFISIHLPKPDKTAFVQEHPSSSNSSGSTNDADHTVLRNSSNRSGSRKGRIKSHRIGRPPGSGLKARLEQEANQRALDQVLAEEQENREKHRHEQLEHHVNHSLLASHPASSRADYTNDEENKPREERSYLEFFPYLSTSVKLEIVDPSEAEAQVATTIKSGHTALSEASTSPADATISPVDEATPPITLKENDVDKQLTTIAGQSHDSEVSTLQEPMEVIPQDTSFTHQNPQDTIMRSGSDTLHPSDDDMDADGTASDREVFFDAKGFMEGETDDSQNSTVSQEAESSGFSKPITAPTTNSDGAEIKVETDAMDIDSNKEPISSSNLLRANATDTAIVDKLQDQIITDANVQESNQNHIQAMTRQSKATVQTHVVPSIKITTPASPPPSSSTVLEPKTPMSMLPKSTFRLIPREEDELEEYHLPTTHNVRYIEPTETELAERVEYDMDEQDEIWLREINAQRRKQDLGEVTRTMFEKIFDRLEKEWFDLTKNIPKPTENLPPEDSACNICDDGECENSNAIVFCDGCNLAVHQDCYGIPYIPEGQWLCRKCMLSPQMPVSCIFCPGEGGAFKQTNTSRWAHLLCASWIPEVGVANVVYMEPIDNIEKIPSSRWKLTCYICKLRMGACIQCETKNCVRAFHVTCARKAHLYMKSKLSKVSNSGGEVIVYRAHCHKHTPRDYKGAIDIAGAAAAVMANKGLKKKRAKIRALDDDSDDLDYGRSDSEETVDRRHSSSADKGSISVTSSQTLGGSRTSKAALAHQKHYSPGAPLAPMLIVNRLLPFVSKLTAKAPGTKKISAQNFLYTICKYWSLKRESRRGAPLLKRLHLEPWTASASAHRQTEEEKTKKLQTQLLLRGDLEKVRMLAELVRKRERAKLKRQELQNRYLSKIMFPLKTILEDTFIEVEKLDRQKYFAVPISAEEVKDYHDIIKNPISFQTIHEKLNAHKYQSVDAFADDVRLIYENCLTYNDSDTTYYRSAQRQSKQAEPLLQKAKEDYESLEIDPRTGFLAVPIDPEIFSYTLLPFQKPDEDDESHTQPEESSPAPKPKHKRKDPTLESPKTPSSSGRTLRGTIARGGSGNSQSTTPNGDAKALVSSTSNESSNSHASMRSGLKPEVPKLKTATVTRADMARAREQSGEKIELGAEDELLEKLKHKSKKSRSLANSLQSSLKPSIVDKAVVIDKPAPKGWAYVVVEGEEDTTEGEDEEGIAARQEAAKEALKAENRRRLKEKALQKKLARETKNRLRSERYHMQKAEKARLLAEALARQARGEVFTEDEGKDKVKESKNKMNESKPAVNTRSKKGAGKISVDVNTPAPDQEPSSTSQPVSPSTTRPQINGGQKRVESSPLDDDMETSVIKKAVGSPEDKDHKLLEKPVDLAHKPATKRNSVSERPPSKSKRRSHSDIEKSRYKENGETEERSRDDDESDIAERSEDNEAVRSKEEPPRKRQKKSGLGRLSPSDELEDESGPGNTRRLRSTEGVPQTPSNALALGPRRSSLAGHRINGINGKGGVDSIAAEYPSAV